MWSPFQNTANLLKILAKCDFLPNQAYLGCTGALPNRFLYWVLK